MTNFASTLLTVVAEMQAKPGKEDELRAQLMALVCATNQEEGCVQYDLHQSIDQPGRFVFYENWTSRAALDKHSASGHIQAFRAINSSLLAEPARILLYTRIG